MNEDKYIKILNSICSYYGISKHDFIDLLNNKENKFLLLLYLKNNNCLNNYYINELFGFSTERKMKNSVDKAEEKFLINSYFRRKYLELEENIKKQID